MTGNYWTIGLALAALAGGSRPPAAPAPPTTPVCAAQKAAAEGGHHQAVIRGIFLAGLEGDYLVGSGCIGQSTFVVFDLNSLRLRGKLDRMANASNQAEHVRGDGNPVMVVFQGEFFGPPLPDPKLPEKIRRIYHPTWGPQGHGATKLEVHAIVSVAPVPANSPCAPPKGRPRDSPCFR